MNKSIPIDSRVYPNLEHLTALSQQGKQLSQSFSSEQLTPLAGKHISATKGRGLDFIELRPYYPGDDVRCMDWKVTQRTGQPFLRVYAQERDKNVALVVDLRNSMFFASDGSMKSALACELASICAGHSLNDTDRVGAILITPYELEFIPFKRGESALLNLLQLLEEKSSQLPARRAKDTPSIDDALKFLAELGLKESQCLVFSDFHDYEPEKSNPWLRLLSMRNHLVGFVIRDPMENKLPAHHIVLGNEDTQVQINSRDHSVRENFERFVSEKNRQLQQLFLT